MRSAIMSGASLGEVAKVFDLLRKQYPERHEFGYYRLADKVSHADELSSELRSQANALGFFSIMGSG